MLCGALEDRQVEVTEKVDVMHEEVDMLEVVGAGNDWEVG